jgi:hypothetical protein
MLREGGIHGNLYAIKGDVLATLKQRGFRLPLGLYRTDPLLGAVLAFGLDPVRNGWDTRRLLVHPHATWTIPEASLASRVRQHIKRSVRQAQGALENDAIRDHLSEQRRTPESLPRTTSEMVGQWLDRHRFAALTSLLTTPLRAVAARRLRRHRDWSAAETAPKLVAETPSN